MNGDVALASPTRRWNGLHVTGAVTLVLAIAAGIAIGWLGPLAAVAAIGLCIGVAIYMAPPLGCYIWLLLSPFTVGVARGDTVPSLRPNEVLLGLIALAIGLRLLRRWSEGKLRWPELGRIDLALGLMLLTGSAMPLLVRLARGLPMPTDDLFYSIVLWKYVAIYALFRFVITTAAQVRACLVLAIASSMVVAVIAVLQVNDLFGVPEILARYYDDPFSSSFGAVTSRGTSTIASSFGVADVMAMTVAVIMAWLWRNGRLSPLLVGAGLVCLLGLMASGQFSGVIGIAVIVVAGGVLLGQFRRIMAYALPMLVVAMLAVWPVLANRLEGFERSSGLPQSWEGRIDNMERFILPELMRADNWLLGVRPAARLVAPEWWRDYVYIESGYVWLVWIGGLPFLFAFLAFAWVALRDLYEVSKARDDMIGVTATATAASMVMLVVLMLFDPHLTMRGGADLFFPLLALALVRPRTRRR